jgi:aerobic carbon-monoxide dehydrogenase medium subunit
VLPTVEIPGSVAEAVGALGDDEVVLAGGTELMPRLTTRATDVSRLVCLRHAGLGGIELNGGRVVVGAAATLTELGRDERLAVLRPVVESIASPTIRNLATVGGNLFVRQPYGDLAVALLALDAAVSVEGSAGDASRPGAAVQDASPFDDAYASAWYRRRVLPVHVRRALLREPDRPRETR